MTTQIDLHLRYRMTDEARFEEYLAIVLPITEQDEPYVLEYELARDEEGIVLQHERYGDEAAIKKHLEVTAEGQRAWGESTELLDIRFVGDLSQAFRTENSTPVASFWSRYRAELEQHEAVGPAPVAVGQQLRGRAERPVSYNGAVGVQPCGEAGHGVGVHGSQSAEPQRLGQGGLTGARVAADQRRHSGMVPSRRPHRSPGSAPRAPGSGRSSMPDRILALRRLIAVTSRPMRSTEKRRPRDDRSPRGFARA